MSDDVLDTICLQTCGPVEGKCARPLDLVYQTFVNYLNLQPGFQGLVIGSGDRTDQVVVSARFEKGDFRKSFVVPVNSEGTWFRASPALREMLQWIMAEVQMKEADSYMVDDDEVTLYYRTIDEQEVSQSQGLFGGGLRVKQLTLGELNGQESHAIAYTYTHPETWIDGVPGTGMGTGAIFADPSMAVSGYRAGDRRIVHSEYYPYANQGGGEVFYEYVTTRRNSDGLATGFTTYGFRTAGWHEIHHPLGEVDPTENLQAKGSEMVSETVPGTIPFELNPFQAKMWRFESGVWNLGSYEKEVSFSLKTDARKLILNNSALLGKPVSEVMKDEQGRTIHEKIYSYKPNYAPAGHPDAGKGPLVKQFYLAENQVQGKAHELGARLPQGVFVDKNQGLYLGLITEEDYDPPQDLEFHGKILLTDEVFNVFRQEKVVTKVYDYPPGLNQARTLVSTERPLVYDYYTGAPVLTQQKQRDKTLASSVDSFHYNLNIPAHVLFSEEAVPSMTSRNMLTQPGLSLKVQGKEDLFNHLDLLANDNGIFDQLQAYPFNILDASVQHWSYFTNSSDGTWRNDAQFSFVHDRSSFKSGWRQVEFDRETPTNLLVMKQPEREPGQGYWETAGQNTRYDALGNVIESRNRLNVFSAAHTIHGNQRVAALFDHAQIGQTYYQGFEDAEPGFTEDVGVFEQTAYEDGHTKTDSTDPVLTGDYLNNYLKVYAGSKSHQGAYALTFTPQNPYGTIAAETRDRYWLSLYFRPTGEVGLAVTGTGIPASVPNPLPLTSVTTKDLKVIPLTDQTDGWFLVRIRLEAASSYALSLDPDAGHLDEVTLYPAAGNGKSGARVSLFGYHPHHRQVTSITDIRGRTVRYEYDERGQLFRVYDIRDRLKTEHYRAYSGEPLKGITGGAP